MREIIHAEEHKKAIEEAEVLGLPNLNGTDEDCRNAIRIRHAHILAIDFKAQKLGLKLTEALQNPPNDVWVAVKRFLNQTDAAWWIANRFYSWTQLIMIV